MDSTQTRTPESGAHDLEKRSPAASEAAHDRLGSTDNARARQRTLDNIDRPDLQQQNASCPHSTTPVEPTLEPAAQHRQQVKNSCHNTARHNDATGDDSIVKQGEGTSQLAEEAGHHSLMRITRRGSLFFSLACSACSSRGWMFSAVSRG